MKSPALASSWWALSGGVMLGVFVGGPLAAVSFGAFGAAFPLSAACSLAALWLTTRRVRSLLADDPLRAFATAVGASGVALFVAICLQFVHLGQDWVPSGVRPRCGPIVPPLLMLAVTALPIGVHLTERAALACHRPLGRLLRPMVAPLALALAALSCLGVVRRASHTVPREPFDRLPVVSTLVASDGTHPLGDVTVTLRCFDGASWRLDQCQVLMHPARQAPPPPELPVFDGPYETVTRGATIQVLRDRRHDLWILQTPQLHSRPDQFAAFRGSTFERVALSVHDYPGEFAPFIGWPVAALLGVAIAAWLARRPRYVDPLPPGPLADATLAADGTLLLADGSTHAATLGSAAPAGPVVVAVASQAAVPYRGHVPVTVVRAGTIAQWNTALRDERDVRYALAFSTLVLLGTPMLFAAWLRLLW